MSNIAFFDSSASTFSLDDSGGTLRALTTFMDSIDGLPGARDLDDVTALSDTGHRFIPSIANVKFSIGGHFDPTVTTGPHAVLGGDAYTSTSTATFSYGPRGSATTNTRITGECWVQGYQLTSKVGSQVTWKADLQIDGVPTLDTFP